MKRKRRCKRNNPKLTYARARKTALSRAGGRGAQALAKRFWGLKQTPEIKVFPNIRGVPKALAGLGHCGAIVLADGPKGKARRFKTIKRPGYLAADSSGRRMFILRRRQRRSKGRKRRFLGYVARTDYFPTRKLEQAGTFKRKTLWQHKHDDEGGKWPRAYADGAGNIFYKPGTLTIGKWLRR